MAGHNKWAQIKRQKGKTDAQKSKQFTKFARLITIEAKKSAGQMSASLKAVIDRAKAVNMPNDSIDRAVKRATEQGEALESVLYESYGPGGSAIIIEALTSNRNKAAAEVKHILSRNGYELAAMGAATWAFTKTHEGWVPNTTVELSDDDLQKLDTLVTELEDNDEVQDVYTNVE